MRAKCTTHTPSTTVEKLHDPCHQPLFAADHTRELDEVKSGAYRSMVGAILHTSHDRGDMQFSAKTLAAYLQRPTANAWSMLGRVVGYLKFTEGYSMATHETSPGLSLFARLGGSDVETNKLLVESFIDADWGTKSTSCGLPYVGGNMVCSTSRSQKAISLSSTESEWLAAVPTTIDALYIRHILQFLLSEPPEQVLRVDNTAVIAISTNLGTSRLKHIEGKLLRLQSKVSSQIVNLTSVSIHYNVAE